MTIHGATCMVVMCLFAPSCHSHLDRALRMSSHLSFLPVCVVGYIVYGCAVIAHFDPAWAASYRENILALVRDYANPSAQDSYFPVLRQFDIFDGHSWAAGLFVFADGRNQESSSESINGYYGMMLLGSAIGNPHMADVGRMLATLEIAGTRAYWHSREGNTVYPDVFAKNKCIGMKWSDKVVEATWFGQSRQRTQTNGSECTRVACSISFTVFRLFLCAVSVSCRSGVHSRYQHASFHPAE
jgi:hypothetical protein